VHFLDLGISKREHIVYETYRKPQCLYMYTPWDSCHSFSVKAGIVATEVIRLLRTNLYESSFKKHIQILISKFRNRGYPMEVVKKQIDSRTWGTKANFVRAAKGVNTSNVSKLLPFKLPYFNGVGFLGIIPAWYRHTHLLVKQYKFVLCNTSNRNMFRLRFSRWSGLRSG